MIVDNAEIDIRKTALQKQSDPPELTPSQSNDTLPVPSSSSLIEMGPPPEFAPYQAEHFEQENHDIVSHDPHLNSDGEALYRFLLEQSQIRPVYRLLCRGTRNEERSRWVTERDSDGRSHSRRETHTETVVDFNFCIDIFPELAEGRAPIPWTVSDEVPAYRGKMVREYEGSPPDVSDLHTIRRKATRKQIKKYEKTSRRRSRFGFPPWIRWSEMEPTDFSEALQTESLQSSKTIRQWADEYCASPKYLKEFVYEKVICGWNIEQLESVVRSTIKATPYSGSVTVEFKVLHSKVYIRPDNKVSRMLSNGWLKFLSIILFIFPFIWLFKRFHSRGGGRWEVCGAAYPLKQWISMAPGEDIPLDAGQPAEQLPLYDSPSSPAPASIRGSSNSSRYMQTPTGMKKLVGIREGEWFRNWEHVIRRAVIDKYISDIPILPRSQSHADAYCLDGYQETPPLIDY